MEGKDFIRTWRDIDLRQYIVDQAKRHSRNKQHQEDFVQEAWLYISLCNEDCTQEFYEQVAYNAIRNLYRKYRKEEHTDFQYYFNSMQYI